MGKPDIKKVIGLKKVKDFQRIIKVTLGDHIRPSGNAGEEDRNLWKVMESDVNPWNLKEVLVLVTKYDQEVS